MSDADPLPRYGERIILRRLSLADLDRFQAYRADPEVGRYQGWAVMSSAEAAAFITEMSVAPFGIIGKWLQVGIAERSTGHLIGDIGICVQQRYAERETEQKENRLIEVQKIEEQKNEELYAEIGFTLSPASHGQGLATEAVKEAIGMLFEHPPICYVAAIADARNTRSIRLLERLGMRLTETVSAIFRGEPCTELIYRLNRAEGAS